MPGSPWLSDAVIDTSGLDPCVVAASTALLASSAGHCTFVSSISAYGTFPDEGLDEDATTAADASEDLAGGYGADKAACERVAAAGLPGRSLTVRPGLLVGPHDPTERFSKWVCDLAAGGRVRAPADRGQPVQFIDARDLADWLLDGIEAQRVGAFNATGPAEPLTFGEMLERVRDATGGGAELEWVDSKVL